MAVPATRVNGHSECGPSRLWGVIRPEQAVPTCRGHHTPPGLRDAPGAVLACQREVPLAWLPEMSSVQTNQCF